MAQHEDSNDADGGGQDEEEAEMPTVQKIAILMVSLGRTCPARS